MNRLPDYPASLPASPSTVITLGMIGLGTVGTGVYKLLQSHPAIQFHKIAVRTLGQERNLETLEVSTLTEDPFAVVRDPAVQVVVEVMGGATLARELVLEALAHKKHVVTANKELIAKYGAELFEVARSQGVRLLFEGAVAGGIPIILPLKLSLAANRILEIAGVLNGTTNYILTKMTDEGWDFADALKEAQQKGFAEADPTNDVEGFDTAYKISILSSIAFKQWVDPHNIFCEGISKITALDIQNAKDLGYEIKLIGLSRLSPSGSLPDVRVHPMLVPQQHPLSTIKNENNAVWIKGDAVGDVMFYGKGAGELPTASAVAADILLIASDLQQGNDPIPAMQIQYAGQADLLPVTDTQNRYYIRLNTLDVPGVMGKLGTICGDFGVSLESVLQKRTNPDGTASIVLITHDVSESHMRQALQQMVEAKTTRDIGCVLRVL